jgi:hypothetical protein
MEPVHRHPLDKKKPKLNPMLLLGGANSPMNSPRNSPRHLLIQRRASGISSPIDSPRRSIQKRGSVTIAPEVTLPFSEKSNGSSWRWGAYCGLILIIGVSVMSAVTVPKLSRMEIDIDYSHILDSYRGIGSRLPRAPLRT